MSEHWNDSFDWWPPSLPIGVPAEAFDIDQIQCTACGQTADECWVVGHDLLCESCAQGLWDKFLSAGEKYAMENVRMTVPFPRPPSPDEEWRCTPEEYAIGDRESWTGNAHDVHCRHRCTNYDALIVGLDRDDFYDQARYQAIRRRVSQLIEDYEYDSDADDYGDAP